MLNSLLKSIWFNPESPVVKKTEEQELNNLALDMFLLENENHTEEQWLEVDLCIKEDYYDRAKRWRALYKELI